MKEEIFTPAEIGCGPSDCSNGHEWEMEYVGDMSNTAAGAPTKWRCKKCLCTRYTYD